MQPVKITAAQPADWNFIYSAWLKSFRNHPWVRSMPNAAYFKLHHDRIEAALLRGYAILAVHPDTDKIVGFAVAEPTPDLQQMILHYVYVKQVYRRFGVAALLLAHLHPIAFYTHKTNFRKQRLHPKLEAAAYTPHLFFK